ncbi:Nramp family divalent metal transporter [Alteromonas sp. 5E99-2]|uniref:Nramp family divalent metal transporter n=1 Tax=Alteromonas sp. 5E99-2 TaxID=2817683 RepID=UPI001A9828C6|nr:Nramp family divalent metal transporter [Alteromonas sp. 5E99-2]MBO1254340.1 Nramp family divalent metal transporter [Alteromonas sp. 5E99-2]
MKNKSGFIIAAAFIGPGTVTTASIAGASEGLHLAWALIFSVIATYALQDMVIRISAITKLPLSENILSVFSNQNVKKAIAALIFLAIGVGNTAYQSGNLTGASIGLLSAVDINMPYWPIVIGVAAALLIISGSYKLIERSLVILVGIMSIVFVVTLVAMQPNMLDLIKQIATPSFDKSTLSLALALIGTTVVPYNLFLHASLVVQTARDVPMKQHVQALRNDSAIAIGVGGFISLVIMTTATVAFFNTQTQLDVANMSAQFKPILGEYAGLFFGLGLFAAGVTSAVTAPLAASYAITSLMQWDNTPKGKAFQRISLSIIAIGVLFATLATSPLSLIVIAQATNAFLLPFVVFILLLVMARHPRLSHYRNSKVFHILGVLILAVLLYLSGIKLLGLVA